MAKRSKKGRAISGTKAGQAAGSYALRPAFTDNWSWGALLVLAVFLTFAQLWHAGFIWDDDYHVTQNPCIIGPLGLKEIWTTRAGMPFPLVFSTFWVEHALWGLQPLPYHLVNVFMHAACAVLLWRVLLQLKVRGAWLGSALWALHPVQVESVAWVAELKNTQSCLFYLGSILFFLKWLEDGENSNRRAWDYAWAVACAALAMASKPSTVILPVVLGLCTWWMKGGLNRQLLLRLAPFLVFSLASTALTMWPKPLPADAIADPHWAQTWPQRIAIAGDAFWFYLGKLLWPHPLMAVYPRWEIDAASWLSYVPLLAAVVLMAGLWLYRETKLRPVFFAFAYYLVALSPFLGLINQSFWRFSFVEDHLQYLACMGPLALAGSALAWLGELVLTGPILLKAIPGGVVLGTLALVSWQRCGVYAGEETLWRDNLAKNPQCWVADNHLGSALEQKGQNSEAIVLLQAALKLYPNYREARSCLGLAFLNSGQWDDAIAQYQQDLAIYPDYAVAHNGLGVALLRKGLLDQAITQFQKAVELQPDYAEAHSNLGGALCLEGRFDEGIVQFRAFLAGNPDSATAHANLGNAYLRNGEVKQAIAEIEEALRLNPGYGVASQLLAKAQSMEQQGGGAK